MKSASAKKASTSANEQLRRSTRQKNPVVRFGYMTRVAEVGEPESYAEAVVDANWRAAMEEEMHTLVENDVVWFLTHDMKTRKIII